YRSVSVGFGAIVWPPIGTRLIDSVPPARIVDAKPHITCSAAYAIACNPDEQKRLTVTADAATGMPARRLAIRATFSPCSASGIAHPSTTSSTSDGSTAGARRSASAIAVAASSSGRVPRRVPFGAFPDAVRTALTITASCMNDPPNHEGQGNHEISRTTKITKTTKIETYRWSLRVFVFFVVFVVPSLWFHQRSQSP